MKPIPNETNAVPNPGSVVSVRESVNRRNGAVEK
jgi:hypothetical protein